MIFTNIIRKFNAAANDYDRVAMAQSIIAKKLVAWAADGGIAPDSILDIASGTGLVASVARHLWPKASITALDASEAMLRQARQKVSHLHTICGDLRTIEVSQKYDAIFSSMALHWLPDPHAALQRWQSWLKPGGSLFVALPVEGSFQEWRDLCRAHGVEDGLWPLPAADFADDLAKHIRQETVTIPYPSARDFLYAMKTAGAATPKPGYKQTRIGAMRKLIDARENSSLGVSYVLRLLHLDAPREQRS